MVLIPFKHLNSIPLEFDVVVDTAFFKGTLVHKKGRIAQLNGTISGSISIPCDLCAETVERVLDEELSFYLSDGIVSENEDELDIVEITTPMINMEELLRSELELIKSDYFCCSHCEGKTVEQEF
ncbi:MAG TPA: YceD family protein [Sulfuricurvum sp.]|nr:YceD family protein [Sulfuricurvum sp.]